MADFCTKCASEMWGTELPPDIDIIKEASKLKPSSYLPVLCEGCGMRGIGKDENDQIMIAVPVDSDDLTNNKVNWVPYVDWEKNYKGFQIR